MKALLELQSIWICSTWNLISHLASRSEAFDLDFQVLDDRVLTRLYDTHIILIQILIVSANFGCRGPFSFAAVSTTSFCSIKFYQVCVGVTNGDQDRHLGLKRNTEHL